MSEKQLPQLFYIATQETITGWQAYPILYVFVYTDWSVYELVISFSKLVITSTYTVRAGKYTHHNLVYRER